MSLAHLVNDGSFACRPLTARERERLAVLEKHDAAKAHTKAMRRAWQASVEAVEQAAKVADAALADYDAAISAENAACEAAQEAGF